MKSKFICFALAFSATISWGETITNTVVIVTNYYNNVYHESVITQRVKNTHETYCYYFTNNVYTISNRTFVVSQTNLNVNVINTNFGPWLAKCETAAYNASRACTSALSYASSSAASATESGSSASAALASAAQAAASAESASSAAADGLSRINQRIQWFDDHSGETITNINIAITTNSYYAEDLVARADISGVRSRIDSGKVWKLGNPYNVNTAFVYRCTNSGRGVSGLVKINIGSWARYGRDYLLNDVWTEDMNVPSGYSACASILNSGGYMSIWLDNGGSSSTDIHLGRWTFSGEISPTNLPTTASTVYKNGSGEFDSTEILVKEYISGDRGIYVGSSMVGKLATIGELNQIGTRMTQVESEIENLNNDAMYHYSTDVNLSVYKVQYYYNGKWNDLVEFGFGNPVLDGTEHYHYTELYFVNHSEYENFSMTTSPYDSPAATAIWYMSSEGIIEFAMKSDVDGHVEKHNNQPIWMPFAPASGPGVTTYLSFSDSPGSLKKIYVDHNRTELTITSANTRYIYLSSIQRRSWDYKVSADFKVYDNNSSVIGRIITGTEFEALSNWVERIFQKK